MCATIPDLASIAQSVGGDDVTVTTFVKGGEDPHFIEARPSFVKALSQADAVIYDGLEMEIGWLPVLVKNSRNRAVQPGGRGDVDCSRAIQPLDLPAGRIDRSHGDVHPLGNPHYLLDPMNGLAVAGLLRDRFSALKPEKQAAFAERFEALRKRLASSLVGEKLAGMYEIEKLMRVADAGKLDDFLRQQKQAELLGGWLGRMRPHAGKAVIADHNMWPYFARRFGLVIAGFMEPKPGIAPTTSHLRDLVGVAKAKDVKAIITGAYFDARHARFLAEQTGLRTAVLAHQVDAREGANDYLKLFDVNIEQLTQALGGGH